MGANGVAIIGGMAALMAFSRGFVRQRWTKEQCNQFIVLPHLGVGVAVAASFIGATAHFTILGWIIGFPLGSLAFGSMIGLILSSLVELIIFKDW